MSEHGARSVIVGRRAELDDVAVRLASARAGAGAAVLVLGEAGIGKSRILAETVRLADAHGMTVLSGRSVAGGGPFRPVAEALVPAVTPTVAEHPRLAPFRALLGRIVPRWPEGPEPDGALVDPIVLLGEAVRELLAVAADRSGLVLAVDDLHWADPESLALLAYLAGRLADLPVLMLATARDDEHAPPGLVQLRRHPSVTEMTLSRLGAADVTALARERAGPLPDDVLDLVVRTGDGLPLLVEELVDAVGRGGPVLPRTIAELTRRRIGTLSPDARDVLRTAAVVSSTVRWELLPAATGHSDREVADALRAATDAALLVRDDASSDALRWRHALTREAVLADLLPPERAAIARASADALVGGSPDPHGSGAALPDGDLARIVAELYAQCGRGRDAARLLLDLARAAVAAGALAGAETTLRRAAELAPDDVDVTVELVRVLTLAGRGDEAEELGIGIRAGLTGERLTQLCLHLARGAAATERWSTALDHLSPVVAIGDPRVDAVRAHVALGEHDPVRAVDLARAAAARGTDEGHPEAVCEALEIVGRALRRTDPAASGAALYGLERCAAEHGLTVWRIRALFELGLNDVYHSGRRDRLLDVQRRAEEAGMLATAAVLDVHIGSCVALCDGHVAMLPFAERAIERADRLGLAPVGAGARFFAAIGHLFADEREPVTRLLDEARAMAPDSMDTSAHYADVEGMAAWVDGDLSTAVAIFDANTERRRRNAGDIASPLWGVRALLRTVLDPTDTGARDDLLAEEIRWHAGNEGARLYADALTAAAAGNRAAAERLISDGDRVLDGHRAWRHLLRLELVRPAAAAGVGSPERWVRAAHTDLVGTGEVAVARRCRQLMIELDVPVPRASRDGVVVPTELRELGVTAREWQVLELVREGLSDPAIAGRLFLSPRTVETHVAGLLRKTGAARRAQL